MLFNSMFPRSKETQPPQLRNGQGFHTENGLMDAQRQFSLISNQEQELRKFNVPNSHMSNGGVSEVC